MVHNAVLMFWVFVGWHLFLHCNVYLYLSLYCFYLRSHLWRAFDKVYVLEFFGSDRDKWFGKNPKHSRRCSLGSLRRSVLMGSFAHHTYLCDAVVGGFMGWIRFDWSRLLGVSLAVVEHATPTRLRLVLLYIMQTLGWTGIGFVTETV